MIHRITPPPASVLEVSCGDGELLTALAGDGYRVRGTNFSDYENADPSLEIDPGVDVRQGLPYPDGSFDVVVAVDIIEHVSDHQALVREVARVLRRDGHSFILTPNIMKLSSRLGFLFTGFHKVKRDFIGFDVAAEHSFAFHNHPVHLPTFLYELHAQGLEYVELDAVQVKPKGLLFWLLLAPFVVPATWFKTHFGEKNLRSSGASDLLFRQLASFKALCGESAVYVSKRVPAPAGEGRTRLPQWSRRGASRDRPRRAE